jgi:DASS family divalent anion:Na+ symporter
MFSGIASLSLSSGLWLTAMAANPLGADIARSQGATITFVSWLIAASVPTLAGIVLLPLALYKVIGPEVTATPEAPREARRALQKIGPMSAKEIIVALTFVGMVLLWGSTQFIKIDSTAVAFLGLGILLATGALTLEDISREGDVLATFIWFAVLYALSDQLNKLGFMEFLGGRLAMRLGGLPPLAASLLLVVAYVAIHYLFVSQTAHLLALFGVFLGVGVRLGVPAAPLALQLLFATNYFSALTPQGSSANLLFAGSGYLTQADLYRLGAFNTAFCLVLYLAIGTPWLMLVAR